MKLFITALALLVSTSSYAAIEKYALPTEMIAAEEGATAGWIALNGICIRAQDTATATRECRSYLEAINLLSNDKLVFTGSCDEWSPKCSTGYQALLTTKALVVPAAQ